MLQAGDTPRANRKRTRSEDMNMINRFSDELGIKISRQQYMERSWVDTMDGHDSRIKFVWDIRQTTLTYSKERDRKMRDLDMRSIAMPHEETDTDAKCALGLLMFKTVINPDWEGEPRQRDYELADRIRNMDPTPSVSESDVRRIGRGIGG